MSEPKVENFESIQMLFCTECGKLMGNCDHTVYRIRQLTKEELIAKSKSDSREVVRDE